MLSASLILISMEGAEFEVVHLCPDIRNCFHCQCAPSYNPVCILSCQTEIPTTDHSTHSAADLVSEHVPNLTTPTTMQCLRLLSTLIWPYLVIRTSTCRHADNRRQFFAFCRLVGWLTPFLSLVSCHSKRQWYQRRVHKHTPWSARTCGTEKSWSYDRLNATPNREMVIVSRSQCLQFDICLRVWCWHFPRAKWTLGANEIPG